MRILGILLLLATGAATLPSSGRLLVKKQSDQDLATYDDACNIGFCSVWGATIGGWGASYTTVRTPDEFASAVSGTEEGVIIVEGNLDSPEGRIIEIGSSKSIIGNPGSSLTGISLQLTGSRNVIIRNLVIANSSGNPFAVITLNSARSIWIDHVELSGDTPYFLSIVNGTDYLSVTHNKFSLPRNELIQFPVINVGRDGEDLGKLHVTFARNWFAGVKRGIEFRYGLGHLLNNYFEGSGVDVLKGGKVLIEGGLFENSEVKSSDGEGVWSVTDSVGAEVKTAEVEVEYPYDWYKWEVAGVKEGVKRWAGQTLVFMVWDK
ncbi:pectin lyase fold/virulence factor [Podospora fimiseda]|uniref:Pectin lyase fold/virulence factor n=1 Tax=Podospora fimiseda TaxID=252190 RepID=A0AAN7GNJ1_9PEZI|nr:pectin lyase fold/virulence factor [Podospora fimiseda]